MRTAATTSPLLTIELPEVGRAAAAAAAAAAVVGLDEDEVGRAGVQRRE